MLPAIFDVIVVGHTLTPFDGKIESIQGSCVEDKVIEKTIALLPMIQSDIPLYFSKEVVGRVESQRKKEKSREKQREREGDKNYDEFKRK